MFEVHEFVCFHEIFQIALFWNKTPCVGRHALICHSLHISETIVTRHASSNVIKMLSYSKNGNFAIPNTRIFKCDHSNNQFSKSFFEISKFIQFILNPHLKSPWQRGRLWYLCFWHIDEQNSQLTKKSIARKMILV